MNRIANAVVSGVLNFLFPRFCYGCRNRIETGWICDVCKTKLRPGLRFGATVLSPLNSLRAVWHYDCAVREAIDDWKFAYLPLLGTRIIKDAFTTEWLNDTLTEPIDSIVGIPPHSYHQRQRGFDPVEQITTALSITLNVPTRNILRRTRNVKPQVKSSLEQRRKNVEGIFSAREKVSGRILLIDDVMTTGSTLREAGKVLLANGAECVTVIVIASAAGQTIVQSG